MQRSFTVSQIASHVNGQVSGDGAQAICGIATLEHAGEGDLSWLGDARYLRAVAGTKATAILAPLDFDGATGAAVIRVSDPDAALREALALLAPPTPQVPPGVHPTAVVADDAQVDGAAVGPHCTVAAGAVVGAGTQLHAGVYVGPGAVIGRDCVLWPNVVLRERVQVGDRVVIHPNATIGADGFGFLRRGGAYLRIPQIGSVVVEDDVEIGANACIDRARSGVTRIRRGTKIDNLVQIAHNCDIGEHCAIAAQTGLSGSVTLETGVLLAGQVGVADHVTVGTGAQIGAQAGIGRRVPPGEVWRGSPAQPIGNENRQTVVLRRLPDLLQQVRDLSKRVAQLESAADHPQRG